MLASPGGAGETPIMVEAMKTAPATAVIRTMRRLDVLRVDDSPGFGWDMLTLPHG